MRSLSSISYFPRLGVTVLGGSLFAAAATLAVSASAAPPKAAAAKTASPKAGAPEATAAPAGPDAATKKAAREAYGAGEKAYSAGDYAAALTEFKNAHDLIPTIHAEYWMAMAQSKGTDPGSAYDPLEAVIASPDAPKLGEEKLNAAKSRLEELKKLPASVSVTSTPPGGEVSVDGAAQPGFTPVTVSVPAGTHKIGVAFKGYEPFTADVTVKPGQKIDQAAELKAVVVTPAAIDFDYPAPKPAAPPPPPKAEQSKVPAYITLGVAVVGAGVGTVFGIKALGAKSDFDKAPTSGNADRAERDALIADMSFGIALTLGITGIVLLTTSDSTEVAANKALHQTARARLDVAPLVTRTTTGAGARFTF
jgi:hypothetical protein